MKRVLLCLVIAGFVTGIMLSVISREQTPTKDRSDADHLSQSLTHPQFTETRINSFTSSTQANASLGMDERGGVVVVWDSRRQQNGTSGVYLQRFDATGQPAGGEQQVNLYTTNMQTRPAVALAPEGQAWVAWESYGQDGSMGSIIARRVKPDGSGSDEILVNETASGHQSDVVVASDSSGKALIVWTTPVGDQRKRSLMARVVDTSGKPQGAERMIASSRFHQNTPSLAIAPSGEAIVVWAETDLQGKPLGVFGSLLNSDGTVMIHRMPINTDQYPLSIEPSVDVSGNGFVVGWMAAEGNSYSAMVRAFDLQGRAVSVEQRVSGLDAEYVSGVAVAAKDAGEYFVSWNQASSLIDEIDKGTDVFVQRFGVQHQRVGDAQRINQFDRGNQRMTIASGRTRLVWGALGRLAAVWNGVSDTDESSVNLTVLHDRSDAIDLRQPGNSELAGIGRPGMNGAARPHEPPVYDPKTAARDPFGGDPDPTSQTGAFGFVGIVNTGWRPPDPILAVGPNQIVAMTNGAIAFFDKDGTKTFQDEIENSFGFWGSLGADNFVFDPEVIYDPHSNRFFAMACERSDNNRSNFLLAVSDDDDPNGNWFKWRLDVTTISDNDIDSPNMAVDDEAVYLTADFFGPDKYLVYMLDKSDLLVGNAPSTTHLLITGSQSYGIPVTYDANAPALYMIQAFEFGTFSSVRMHAVTDPLGTPQRVTTDVSVPTYGHPQDPPQMGTSSRPELFEARFWSCVYRNGSLWAVHHHSPTPSDPARARWYEFDMNGWPDSGNLPFLIQSGEVTPGGNVSTFFPSIWVDDNGNAAITCARSSPSEFFSMSRALRESTDPLGTFGALEFVRESTASYTLGRWGDYSGTMSDPAAPNTFWGIHEYTTGGNSWNTWIGQYVLSGPVVVEVEGLTVIRGILAGGNIDDLDNSDDSHVIVDAGAPISPLDPPVSVEVDATAPSDTPADLSFTLEARTNLFDVQQAIELFNYNTGQFEEVDSRLATFTDSVVLVEPTGDLTRFVEAGTNSMKARLTWLPNTPPIMANWSVWIDQAIWTFTP